MFIRPSLFGVSNTFSFAFWFITLLLLYSSSTYSSKIIELNIKGPIGPATADYIVGGIDKGQKADLILVLIDTPGGLDASMRLIIQKFLSSAVPIVTYVSPHGARAASAGTYLLYASTVAAMAPGTELGAASPVSMSEVFRDKKNQASTESKKTLNDALATIRSLAQLRGRDPIFAGKAVSNAETMTATEALKTGVINYIASDITDLLRQLNGVTVVQNNKNLVLNTSSPQIERLELSWFNRFLSIITNPTITYFLLLLGIYGIFFELFNPGFVLPGVIGSVALLMALYALQLLPINYLGFSLIILGVFFIIAEGFTPSFGALGLGGTAAFVLGSMMLINTNDLSYQIAWSAIWLMAVINILLFVVLVGAVYQSRQQTVRNGLMTLIGATGRTIGSIDLEGQAVIRGEIWHVQSKTPIPADTNIRVTQAVGLLLEVEKDE